MSEIPEPFASSWIESVLGVSGGRPQASFTSFTTDSRKLRGGELFVAIAGEAFDGHDFIEAALAAGASGVLAESAKLGGAKLETLKQSFPQAAFFGVTDVQNAYRKLGQAWRSRFKIPVIVVAGSNGKTTTKELLAAMLQGRWPSVLRTVGSQNGFLGIPMTLLELRSHHGAAVIEVGIDDVGAMSQHIDCVSPTHSVLTVIGPEHLENLKDVETVAREELLALSQTLARGGKIAVNLDDPHIAQWAAHEAVQGLRFSLENPAVEVLGTVTSSNDLEIRASGTPPQLLRLTPPLPGRHNCQNLLAATSIALLAGLSADEITRGLATFQGAEGRSQVRPLAPSRKVICDYYNASPVSMKAAFELLRTTGSPQDARWACLADMKELGENELQFHRELAPLLLQAGPAGVLLHGPRMESLRDELKKSGFAGVLEHFETPELLAQSLKSRLGPRDIVLIKGSRSMKMEKVWEALRA